jgi:hypothetical protein
MSIRIMKSRTVRWAGHVARMVEEERLWDVGGKARGKEATRKTKTLDGSCRGGMG